MSDKNTTPHPPPRFFSLLANIHWYFPLREYSDGIQLVSLSHVSVIIHKEGFFVLSK
ncbi:unnamed protein product [Meloidogyne enterolobii]|uniref:Uncharacterized protein n=1 Tax=Meloidogyne enterolobii TaxID=390850 RepID=A0ACB0ZQN5_MELEN